MTPSIEFYTEPLQPLPVLNWLPKPIQDKVKMINGDVQSLQKRRSNFATSAKRIRVTRIEDIDPAEVSRQESEFQQAMIRILQDELALQNDMNAVVEEMNGCVMSAKERANKKHADTRARVKKKLESIGYIDTGGKLDLRVPGSISPDMIARHPDVWEARVSAQSFDPSSSIADLKRKISAAIRKIEDIFDQLLNRVVGGS